MKSRGGNSDRREKNKKDDQRRERVRRKKMQVREKVEKTRNIVFFPMFCGPGGSKSGLAKVAGAKPFGRMRDKQLHDAVARSIFRSQHVKNTSASEPFWKLRCRKSACRCGAKMREANFEVKMCKAQRSWRTFGSWHVARVHGVCKAHRSRGSFGRWDVETVRAIVAWSTFRSQSHNVESTSASEPFWKLRCRKCARNYNYNYSCSSNCNCARTT